jgi:hypothetical protein
VEAVLPPRGALSDNIVRIHEVYDVPASNTAVGLALSEERGEPA